MNTLLLALCMLDPIPDLPSEAECQLNFLVCYRQAKFADQLHRLHGGWVLEQQVTVWTWRRDFWNAATMVRAHNGNPLMKLHWACEIWLMERK